MIFKVAVRGNPKPSLTWYHQDTQLTSDYSLELQQDGSLSIVSTELRHSGVYRLVAKNSKGSAERQVTLTVRQEPEEETAAADKKVLIKPTPVSEFGEYVAECHSNSNEVFKLQYNVNL